MKEWFVINGTKGASWCYEGAKGKEFCKARRRMRGKYDICLCGEEIKDDVRLMVTNSSKIPNILLHKNCPCPDLSSQDVANWVYGNWQMFQELVQDMKRYSGWICSETFRY